MSLKNYSLLRGSLSNIALDDDDSPHIEFRVEALGISYRAAINVRSKIAPHDLLYLRVNNYDNATLTDAFLSFPQGVTGIENHNSAAAIDFVHGGLFSKSDMSIAPYDTAGNHNDLKEFIIPLAESAKDNTDIEVYILGESWGPENSKSDKYFGFLPGNGIHDIHMNQGSGGSFSGTNGPKQDGALFFNIKSESRWVAIFLAFQSQDWNTDATTGHPIDDAPLHPVNVNPLSPSISIIAALINAAGNEEGNETVTLLNRSDASVDLSQWQIQDGHSRALALNGVIHAGESLRFYLVAQENGPRLSNKSGEIRLVSNDGSIAHSIKYGKNDVAQEGWTSIF